MAVDTDSAVREPRRILAQVTGVLLPPLAVLAGLEAAYAWTPRACATQNELPIHLAHVLMLGLIVLAGVIAWREWRAVGGGEPGDGGSTQTRQRFLGIVGVSTAGLFLVVALAQWLPPMFISPCQ